MVGGEEKTLLVHRKGSTRAFPPHHPLIPVDYQLTGQPVLIGGTMGTHSYVLTGICGVSLCSLSSLPSTHRRMDLPVALMKQSRVCEKALLQGISALTDLIGTDSLGLTSSAVCRHRKGHGRDVREHMPWRRARLQPQQRPKEPGLPDGAPRCAAASFPVPCTV